MSKFTLNPVIRIFHSQSCRSFSFILFFFFSLQLQAQVAINTDGTEPHSSAMLEVKSNNLGFLPPRVTLANRPANPATGLMVFQTDGISGYYFFDGITWQRLGTTLSDFWQPNATDIYFSSGRVSIGSTASESNGLRVTNYVNGKAAVKGNVEQIPNLYATGMLGVLGPALMGVPLSVMTVGVLGIKPNAGSNGAAVYGWNNDDNPSNYGGVFISDGVSINNNYAVYAEAKGGAINYSGQFKGRVLIEGNTGNANAADSLNTLFSVQVKHTQASDSKAVEGLSIPKPGYGVGVFGSGGWKGLYGEANGNGYTGWVYGVQGNATSGLTGTAVGVYGSASGGLVNWAGYFDGECYIANGLKISVENTQTPALQVEGNIYGYDLILEDAYPLLNRIRNTETQSDQYLKSLHSIVEENSSDPISDNRLSIIELNEALVERIEAMTSAMEVQNKRIKDLEIQLKNIQEQNQQIKK